MSLSGSPTPAPGEMARIEAWAKLSEPDKKKAWLTALVSGSEEDKAAAWKILSDESVFVSQKEILKAHIVSAGFDSLSEFTTKMVYGIAEEDLQKKFPENKTVRSTILANLQFLRDDDYIKFVRRGVYSIVEKKETHILNNNKEEKEWTYKQHLKFQEQSGVHYDPTGEILLAQHD
jgi:hypothetical protein